MPVTESAEIPGYRLLEPVGRGGFSVVYRACQEALDRQVAVKLLTVDYIDAKVRKRFEREVRATTQLSGHPNVVSVVDAGVTRARQPYIVMDFCEYGSLQHRLDGAGPFPVPEVVHVGVKICAALTAAHQLGIIHRDIKPQNILVTRFGEPALADFGIASLQSSVARSSGTQALTPYHAAPEMLEGQQGGPAADIYSLGSTLYHLLAGHPAYHTDSDGIAALLLRIINEPPPPLKRRDVPPPLRDAIARAMAKRPAERFADAAEFAAALRGPLAYAPPPAPGPRVATLPDAGRTTDPAADHSTDPAGAGFDTTGARTVLRADRQRAAPLSGHSPKRTWLLRWGPLTGAACAIALAAGLTMDLTHGAQRHLTQKPAPTVSGVARNTLDEARPVALTAIAEGPAVRLRWRNPAGGSFPLFVETRPRPFGGSGLKPAGTGADSALVTGLSPATGYCFKVGAVVRFGNPSVVAWSAPVCVRGAKATG
jgi:tRNA A-37 threonylcarbamoyl transferase component Bud32